MPAPTNIPLPWIGADPEKVQAFLLGKGAQLVQETRWQHYDPLFRHYLIGSDSKTIHVRNNGQKVTDAYLFDWPDSGWQRDLQSPIVTKLLFAATTAAFTAGLSPTPSADPVGIGGSTSGALSQENIVMFDDFGVPDIPVDVPVEVSYADVFDPVDFTSGESLPSWSDAQNVDYGFGADVPTPPDDVLNTPQQDFRQGEIAEQNLNATMESGVSDYGVTWPKFDDNALFKQAGQVVSKLPMSKPGPVPASQAVSGTRSGGGASSTKGTFWTPQQARPPLVSNLPNSSTAAQVETVQPRSFWGQLTPGSSGASNVGMWLALAGVGLLVWGMVHE